MESINETVSTVSRHNAPEHDMSRHTLTIKQASELFTNLGVPRATRSIQRFCENNSIDCIRVKGEKTERYFINEQSVERYAKELQQLERITHIDDDMLRRDAPQRDTARHVASAQDDTPSIVIPQTNAVPRGDTAELRMRVDVLEKENFQLKIDRSAKEQVIGHIMDERRDMVDRLTEQSREIGRLETQLLQLAAPERDASRHDATEIGAHEIEVEDEVSDADTIEPDTAPLNVDEAPPRRSIWSRFFG